MEHTDYSVEDFIKDEYFQKWIIQPDQITLDFWQKWVDEHPEKKETIQCATKLMLLICTESTFELSHFDADALWSEISQRKDKIEIKNFLKPTIPEASHRGISPVSSRLTSGTKILYLPRPELLKGNSDLPKGRYNRKPRGRAIGELYRLNIQKSEFSSKKHRTRGKSKVYKI